MSVPLSVMSVPLSVMSVPLSVMSVPLSKHEEINVNHPEPFSPDSFQPRNIFPKCGHFLFEHGNIRTENQVSRERLQRPNRVTFFKARLQLWHGQASLGLRTYFVACEGSTSDHQHAARRSIINCI